MTNGRLKNLQTKQFKSVISLQSRRGSILDRQGRELALSTTSFSIYADPKLIEEKKKTAKQIAKLTGQPYEGVLAKIKDAEKRFVWIERFMDEKKAKEAKDLKLKGIGVVEEWKRVYPNEGLLAHTLGLVGNDGQGLEGLELEKDQLLQGTKKKVVVRRDARGRPLMVDGLLFAENPEGSEVKLTIDSELQYQLETELTLAKQEHDATSAVGIILDAKTSAVRALAVVPGFDPNLKSNSNDLEHRRNRVVTDAFEPGSVMKPFVIAKGLKEKKIQPNSKFFCEFGNLKIGKRTVKDSDEKHKFGWLPVTDILAHSSNIGMSKIAFSLGEGTVRSAYEEYGFGQKYNLELPGEGKGILQPLPWNTHLLANVSFGQGVSATALQVANAYAALINGGLLNKPYLIESIKEPETGVVTEFKPQLLRQVLPMEDSEKMRMMLVAATGPNATGEKARVSGFMVGGKTGTAQKAAPNGGGYIKGAYISSFAGFIPAQDPRFVIYIVLDHPKKAYYGSEVAAPVFSRLASFAVRREGVAPLLTAESPVKVRRKTKPIEVAQKPQGPHLQNMPDLKSLSIREVFQKLHGQDVHVRIQGQGAVSETIPAAGDPLGDDKAMTVILR